MIINLTRFRQITRVIFKKNDLLITIYNLKEWLLFEKSLYYHRKPLK